MFLFRRRPDRRKLRPVPSRCRPQVELLEDRRVPATLTVTSAADSGAGTLRALVGSAAAGDTINFAAGITTISLLNQVQISKSLTITDAGGGSDVVLDGASLAGSGLLVVQSATSVTLAGLILQNVNQTTISGGAIFNLGNLTVQNCTFAHNAAQNGGAIVNGDGASAETLTLTNCTFTSNIANATGNGSGGAILNQNLSTVTATGCTFSTNTAASGGAIYSSSSTTFTIHSSTFTSNQAKLLGGAVFNSGTLIVDSNSTFSSNQANNSPADATQSHGGAIFNNTFNATTGGVATLTSVTFTNNSSTNDGGAVFNQGNLTATNCTFTTNSAVNAGAIADAGPSVGIPPSNTTLHSTSFSGNTATLHGGAINNSGVLIIDGASSFSNNKVTDTTLSFGGAIYNDAVNINTHTGGQATITSASFTSNTSANQGGGVFNLGVLAATTCAFSNNTAVSGAAVDSAGTFTLTGCTFTSNQGNATTGGGGAILLNAGSGTAASAIVSGTFTNNSAFDGGAILISGGTLSISTSRFTQNIAIGGGAIWNDTNGILTITGTTIGDSGVGNSAFEGGGLLNQGGTVTLIGCTVAFNLANNPPVGATTATIGAGIVNGGGTGTMTLINCTVANNTLQGPIPHGGAGAGIYNQSLLTIVNCTIAGNTVAVAGSEGGGGIFNETTGTLNITNVLVVNNTVPSGDPGPDLANLGTINIDSHNMINNVSGVDLPQNGVNGDIIGGLSAAQIGLGTLQDNGGPTLTFSLLITSLAIDAGTDTVISAPLSLSSDQRPGAPRKQGAHVDIGSFEFSPLSLDVDANGTADPLTDGILILRFLFHFTGSTLTSGALGAGAQRTDPTVIANFLNQGLTTMLDVDSNGTHDPLTDGILILRYLFKFTGSTLTSGALGAGATRTLPADIQTFLDGFNPGHLFADSIGPGAAPADVLTQAELDDATAAAIARWKAIGLTSAQQSALASAHVQLANLSGFGLGLTVGNNVSIDADAAGYGWFVDPTPANDSEFQTPVGSSELDATSSSPAANRMDLLTVVMHELGLVMGLKDIDPSVQAHSLMTDVLAVGVRRLPA